MGSSCANTSSVVSSSGGSGAGSGGVNPVGGGISGSKNTRIHPSATAVAGAVAAAVTTTPLDHPGSSKGSTLGTSKRAATSSTSSEHADKSASVSGATRSSPHEGRGHRHSDTAAQSHHHHHHHHHHHAASKRVKNRSRKKKPSRASSSAASMETSDLKEALVSSSGIVPIPKIHDPPKHQHSAATLLSSVAAASVAMASMDSTSGAASAIGNIASAVVPGSSGTVPCTAVPSSGTNAIPTKTSSTEVPTPTVGAVASATVSMIPSTTSLTTGSSCISGGATGSTIMAEMETKCTQTKLEDELETMPPVLAPSLILETQHQKSCAIAPTGSGPAGSSTTENKLNQKPPQAMQTPSIITSTTTAEHKSKSTTAGTTSKSGCINEGASAKVASPAPEVEASATNEATVAENTTTATTATESKGEIGTWTSSTEVCPWEDEENRRESHAPFVKTYATLGYL